MIEVVIPLLTMLSLVAGGLALWRHACAPSHSAADLILRTGLLGLVSSLVVAASAWRLSSSRTCQLFGTIVSRVNTPEPVVALTFDDGPSPQFSEEVLSLLEEQSIRATFFVTGRAVEANMTEARRLVEAGHELGNHSYSHQRMMLKSYAFVKEEIERTDRLIREAGYEGDIHFRSPFTKKFIVLPYYLGRAGRLNISFDVEPESYPEVASDAQSIIDHVLSKTRPGSIVLLHVMAEGRAESRKAVPGIVQGLRERGYHFVTISELLAAR